MTSHRGVALAVLLLLPACRLVGGGGGGDDAADEEPPAFTPAAELGSVALTASCSSPDKGRVQTLSLGGGYDCTRTFTVTMTNEAADPSVPIQMQLVLQSVGPESDEPIVGPTGAGAQTPGQDFALRSATLDGEPCKVGDVVAVCDVDPLSPRAAVEVELVIDPAPRQATVTTQVALGEAPGG